MESVSIMPASLADRIPLPDEALTARMLAKAREGFDRKIVVLDDDPTGVQTVHDLPVYTDWRRETLESGLTEEGTMFFVLTNSRGFSQQETEHAHREIAENLLAASEKTGVPFLLVSRGDSTLRGHYPLETETLRQTLEEHSSVRYDGEIVMPYFKEGGRLTIGNVHYVQTGDCLTPAGLTEFARDTTFAYNASNLLDWCEERTGGHYTARDMTAISLEELRALDYDTILQKLMAVKDFGKVIVNAAEDRDVEVFTAALLEAVKQGKEFLIRSAAGLVRVLGNVDHRPLLKREELRGTDTGVGGLVVVGSHVKKTTEQLECLLNAGLELCPICFDEARIQLEDVVKELHLSSILIADAGLGTINSVVLTVEYMKAHDLPLKGIIFNHCHPGNVMEEDNIFMCEHMTGLPTLARVCDGDTSLSIDAATLSELYDEVTL